MINFDKGWVSSIRQYDGGQITLNHYDEKSSLGQVKEVRLPSDLVLRYEYGADNRVAAINIGRTSRLEYTYDGEGRLVTLKQVPLDP